MLRFNDTASTRIRALERCAWLLIVLWFALGQSGC